MAPEFRSEDGDDLGRRVPAAMLGELPPLHFIARLSGGRTLKGRIPILLTEQ